MPDFSMRDNRTCWLRFGCKRSPSSGTKPTPMRQAWTPRAPIMALVNSQTVHFCTEFWPAQVFEVKNSGPIREAVEGE